METIEIPKATVEMLEAKLQEAIDICIEAGPTDLDNPNQAPTSTYAGATGWSTATMSQTLFTLRCWTDHFDD